MESTVAQSGFKNQKETVILPLCKKEEYTSLNRD
jgi:hypothetical protein